MNDVPANGEKIEKQKIKVQEGRAKDDEDLDFEDFAEDDANMVAGIDDTDIINDASTTFWI